MKNLQRAVLCLLLVVQIADAQNTKSNNAAKSPAATSQPGLPQLIDRELFFDTPEIGGAQISPDGKYISFGKPWRGTRNVWVKGVDEPFSAARLVTAENRPIGGYYWTYDSKYILYIKDNDGDENFNLYAVDPSAKPAEGADAPPARDLTGLKGVRVNLVDRPKHDPDTLYIGLNDRDKAWHDLYKLKVSTGEKMLVRKNTERISGWIFDLDGNLRLATRAAENGDNEILRVDADKFTRIYSCNVFEECGPFRFQKGNRLVYIRTNKGDDMNLIALALLDPATGETKIVESDPMKKVDLSGVAFSEVTDEPVATSYLDDQYNRHYFNDKKYESDYKLLKSKLPGMEVVLGSHTLDENLTLVLAFSDTEPEVNYLFNRKTRQLTKQYTLREKLPREALAKIKVVRYPSSDGLEIPAYLTLPKGVAPKNLPTIILPHGGPWGRERWGYASMSQFYANRGYAVLSPNFRGSTGYGKKFLDAGNLEWGKKMQDDITWGVKYLVAQGIADPKRIGITGASYGGYATLAGLVFTPDLYAAGVDMVGPSNLITLLQAIPAYWEAERKRFYKRMGDPTTPEGKALMVQASPLTHAAQIKTPLLVVQGANDPRVNKREADQIVVALRDRGFPVEYIVAPDEGHGFRRPVNVLAMMMAAEKFMAKHLGGRYQEGGSDQSVKRLAEITVDPKTVTVGKLMDAKSVGVPKAAADLVAGTYKYQGNIAAGSQQMAVTVTTTVKEENGGWTVVEHLEATQGQTIDTATLEKGTLVMRKRNIQRGAVTIDLDVAADNKAAGKMSRNGQERTMTMELGGPLFADVAACPNCLASLPLADGYTTSLRNLDVQRQKEKVMELKVVGTESVTVPAGTFDSYKVEITSDTDKQMLWVAKDSRKPVKMSVILSSMGGATLTAELMP